MEASSHEITARGKTWNKRVVHPAVVTLHCSINTEKFPRLMLSLLYTIAVFQSKSLKMCVIMAKSKSKF